MQGPRKPSNASKGERRPFIPSEQPIARPRAIHDPAILEHLAAKDAKLARLIREVGPVRIELDPRESAFESLATSILYQQLSGKAAATILGRLKALFPGRRRFPSPDDLLGASEESLRSVGVSRAKALALKDLARRVSTGEVPPRSRLSRMSDEEIIERLIEVRGIGRWTVEMFLIFTLGRTDVLPVDDYGVKKGFAAVYGWKELPTARDLASHCEKWRPYRSVGSWYMWRALELPEYASRRD